MPLRRGRAFLAALVAVGLLASAPVAADESSEMAQKRSDLEDVKRRIRELQKEIAGTEESRSSAIEIEKCGTPCKKLVVPSSGSTIQR